MNSGGAQKEFAVIFIREWKAQSDHLEAQARGKTEWYLNYEVQICEVLRSYSKAK